MTRRERPKAPPAPEAPASDPLSSVRAADPAPDKGIAKPKLRRGMGNRKHVQTLDAAASALRRQRRVRVFELRALGESWANISESIGISITQVKADYKRGAAEYGQEEVSSARAQANLRYDDLYGGLYRQYNALLPYTRPRRVTKPDGTEETVPPDPEFVSELRGVVREMKSIANLKAKLNGAVVFKMEVDGQVNHAHLHAAVPLEDALSLTAGNLRDLPELPAGITEGNAE